MHVHVNKLMYTSVLVQLYFNKRKHGRKYVNCKRGGIFHYKMFKSPTLIMR